jgi:hypothetical protein
VCSAGLDHTRRVRIIPLATGAWEYGMLKR